MWLSALLLFALFAAAIVGITWPWAETFSSRVLDHWDPPFHAWKLEYAARQILAGRVLPPEGNTNMYYPYTGAFYYEALHWPQAVFAALLLACGAGPVLACHATLVAFWALSGVCFWMMLRALGLGGFAAAAGGMMFVLMPYRVSYMVEFNMQLNFGLPLFFYFLIRFFQSLGNGGGSGADTELGADGPDGSRVAKRCWLALGMALAWWLQAASELYQAVYLVIVAPFFMCAMLSCRWRALRDWRGFWLPLAIAAAAGGALSLWFLWPYFTTLQSNTLARGLREIRSHVLDPLSYLLPFNGRVGIGIDARCDEMSAYPTLSVLLLAGACAVGWARRRLLSWSVAPLAAALALFAAVTVALYFSVGLCRFKALYGLLPVAAVLLAIPFLLSRRDGADAGKAFMRGLFGAAVFAFFMSLGPRIMATRVAGWAVSNTLFMALYNNVEAMRGFRVVSRFSIFVMMFLVAAAALALDKIAKRKPSAWAGAAIAALAALFVLESLPPKSIKKTMPLEAPLESEVLKTLDERAEPFVLAMLPMGNRRIDSQMMLQVARDKRLSVYAWGGTYPEYTQRVCAALLPQNDFPAKFGADILRQLWPEALLIEDKKFSRARLRRNFAAKYSEEAAIVAEDGRFVLMSLNADDTPKPEWLKLVRHDYAANNPVMEFSLEPPPPPSEEAAAPAAPAKVWLDCNGAVLGEFSAAPAAGAFRVALPPDILSKQTPVRLRFHAEDDAPFVLRGFAMRPAAAGAAAVAAPTRRDLEEAHRPPLPWIPVVGQLPPAAQPLSAAYRNGLKIHAAEVLEADFTPGKIIRVRYYITLPEKISGLMGTTIRTGVTKDGAVLAENGGPISRGVDMNYFWTGLRGGFYVYDHAFRAPAACVQGEKYGLVATVRATSGKRMSAKSENGKKLRRLPFDAPNLEQSADIDETADGTR